MTSPTKEYNYRHDTDLLIIADPAYGTKTYITYDGTRFQWHVKILGSPRTFTNSGDLSELCMAQGLNVADLDTIQLVWPGKS